MKQKNSVSDCNENIYCSFKITTAIAIFLSCLPLVAHAEQYLTAENYIRVTFPDRVKDPEFQEAIRKQLELNYPGKGDWTNAPVIFDTISNRVNNHHDYSKTILISRGKPTVLIETDNTVEYAYSFTPDSSPHLIAMMNCGQPARTFTRRELDRTETEAERTERRKKELETNISVSASVKGQLAEASVSYSQRVVNETETTERNKMSLTQEIEDTGEISLLENGITLLQESVVVRISKQHVPGKAILTMPINVTYVTGNTMKGPFGIKLPITTSLKLGDWSMYDSMEHRSLPMDADVTVRSIIKIIGPVATQTYLSADECRNAADTLNKQGKLPEDLRTVEKVNILNNLPFRAVDISHIATAPADAATQEVNYDPISMEEDQMNITDSSTHLECTIRSARGSESGSNIRTSFDIEVRGCDKPKSTYGQITYGFRYIDEQSRQEFVRNNTSRWSNRVPPRFSHDATDRKPNNLDKFLETIDAHVIDCECK